jgi:hypothetical protein
MRIVFFLKSIVKRFSAKLAGRRNGICYPLIGNLIITVG